MATDILYIIDNLGRGGAETHLLRILPLLDREHFRVKIFVLSERGALANEFRESGITIVEPWFSGAGKSAICRAFCMGFTMLQLFLYLLFVRPRITHFFLPKSYLIAGPVSLLACVPVRIMSRRSLNHYQQKYPPFVRRFEHWLHQRMHAVLGNSQRVVQQLVVDEKSPSERTHLIYNGVEVPSAAKDNLRIELCIEDGSIVFVIVANLIPYKGHQDLLHALAVAKLPNRWDLLIVGKDSAGIQEELARTSQELGIAGNVHFLGQRSDVNALLQCADIGLLTSHEEGFSNAILECMAIGLPMIVTDVGGNAEAVEHDTTGLVVPAKDPEALACAIERLCDDADLRQRFGDAGKKRLTDTFSLQACVDGYENLYRTLAG